MARPGVEQILERAARAARELHEAIIGTEPEPEPTLQEVLDQLDVVRWFRFMLEIDADFERY